jgi:hypothetical protein
MKLGCGLLKLSEYGGGSLLFHRFPVHSMDSSLIQSKQVCEGFGWRMKMLREMFTVEKNKR